MDNDDPAAQEARVKKLWQVLDTKKEGQVSLNGLKNGLRKMDHRTRCILAIRVPLFTLDQLSRMPIPFFRTCSKPSTRTAMAPSSIMVSSKPLCLLGRRSIQCAAEFRKFVEHTEKELWQLFKSIDRNRNGQLDKDELRQAFLTAGIHLPPSKLDQFFSEVDTNHDGVITFDEWRYDPTQWISTGDAIT